MKFRIAALALACALAASCGASDAWGTSGGFELVDMPESRALVVIKEALLDHGYSVETNAWTVDVGWASPLLVDLRASGTGFGIEWVSAEDQSWYGSDVPPPAPHGQLRIVSGRDFSDHAQVLLLHASSYQYRARDGREGQVELEFRIRQDVRDFVSFARGRGR